MWMICSVEKELVITTHSGGGGDDIRLRLFGGIGLGLPVGRPEPAVVAANWIDGRLPSPSPNLASPGRVTRGPEVDMESSETGVAPCWICTGVEVVGEGDSFGGGDDILNELEFLVLRLRGDHPGDGIVP